MARVLPLKAALAAAAALLPVAVATAQAPPVPTREEVARPPPEPTEAATAQLTVEGGVERAPCALDRPDYRHIRFTLRGVVFDLLRGLTADQLRAAYAPYVGQEHNVALICEIRDRA